MNAVEELAQLASVTLPIDDQPIPGAHEQYLRKPLAEQITIGARDLFRALAADPDFGNLSSKSRLHLMGLTMSMSRWAGELSAENLLARSPAARRRRFWCGWCWRLVGRKRA